MSEKKNLAETRLTPEGKLVEKEKSEETKTEGGKEKSKEQQIQEEVKKEALSETREYFEKRQKDLEELLSDPNFQERVENLFQNMSETKSEATDEQIKDCLGSKAEDKGMVDAMRQSIDQCKHTADFPPIYNRFAQVMREEFNVDVQMRKTTTDYDNKTGWHHTTPEGQAKMAEHEEKIRNKFENKAAA